MDQTRDDEQAEPAPPVLGYAHGDYREKPPPMTFGEKITWIAGVASGLSVLTSIGTWSLRLQPLFMLAGILWVVVAAMWVRRATCWKRDDEPAETKWVDRHWRRVVMVLFLVPLMIMVIVPRYTCPHGILWGAPGVGYAYSANGGPCRNTVQLRSWRVMGNWYVWTGW